MITMIKRNGFIAAALVVAVIGGGIAVKSLIESGASVSREQQLVILINNYRAQHHLSKLTISFALTKAAREHSQDMLNNGYFDHRGFPQRVRKYKNASYIGENIAWGGGGFAQPYGILSLWRSSPPHKKILLTAKFKQVGIGFADGTFSGQSNATMTTADFSS